MSEHDRGSAREAGECGDATRTSITEADLYVANADGRIVRPSIVTVSDARTGLIQSATVQESHDGKE